MGNLEKALKYPFAYPGWGKKILIGGGISFLGVLFSFIPYIGLILCFISFLFPLGYAYRVLQNSILYTEKELPAWENWGFLFSRGLFVFLIGLGYGIIPGLLYWLGKNLWYGGGLGAFFGVFSLVLGIAIGLVAFFLLPMALALFASHGELLGTAFHWRSIVEKIWLVQKDYFKSWIAALVLYLAIHFILLEIPFLGIIIYSFGAFYLTLSLAYLFGKICREVVKEEI